MATSPEEDAIEHYRWVQALLDFWRWLRRTRLGNLLALLGVVLAAVITLIKIEDDLRKFACRNSLLQTGCTSPAPAKPVAAPSDSSSVPSEPSSAAAQVPAEVPCDNPCRRRQLLNLRANYDVDRRGALTVEQERTADGILLATRALVTQRIACEAANGRYQVSPTPIAVDGDELRVQIIGDPDQRLVSRWKTTRTELKMQMYIATAGGSECSAKVDARQTTHLAGFDLECKAGACWGSEAQEHRRKSSLSVLLAFPDGDAALSWARAFARWTSIDNSDFDYCLSRGNSRSGPYCPTIDHAFAVDWHLMNQNK